MNLAKELPELNLGQLAMLDRLVRENTTKELEQLLTQSMYIGTQGLMQYSVSSDYIRKRLKLLKGEV
ncbi:MAG: hypothetical protein JWL86_6969 [Rhizobium sp.]|nr:hypothetical protein [Rhizobium sp.]